MHIKAFSVKRAEFDLDGAVYRQAKADDRVDHEVDVYVSDMDGETVLVEPDGTVVNPYGNRDDLLDLARPVLDEIPTWQIEQYVAGRRGEEE